MDNQVFLNLIQLMEIIQANSMQESYTQWNQITLNIQIKILQVLQVDVTS